MIDVDVVVIGAGQAGLSAAYFLRRFGLSQVVLDAEDSPGGAWRHRSPTLTMDRVHGIFDLPGMSRPAVDPGKAAAEAVPDYFASYESQMGLDVVRPHKVGKVEPGFTVDDTWRARGIVNASGTWTRPHWPFYPGRFDGRQLHYASYAGPAEFAGLNVVVVGGGHSAMHVLSEVGAVARSTLWVTRREPDFRPEGFDGRDVVALVDQRVRSGLPPQSVVSVTGLTYTPVVTEALERGVLTRRPMFTHLVSDGVSWGEEVFRADVIVWATGFRADLRHLAPLKLREPGGGIRMDGTRVVVNPLVHLVGYGPSASTVGANRAGREAARDLARRLAPHSSLRAG
ncbi:NAD(P)/FAD-dependent oxidoreductase [Herbidospora galbida]|uniref:NAD(P)/FAD-dependent oxidoreductase n=1 Tax=Herbidospora galbida TaxID=2575442 RepID=A0A4U3MNU4_9ACTN|nr:NAD(P)/FAD-dependent oxidoreductase [Herbidospora galbida]